MTAWECMRKPQKYIIKQGKTKQYVKAWENPWSNMKKLKKIWENTSENLKKNLRKNEEKPGRGNKGGTACDFSRSSPRRRAFSCSWAMRGRWWDRIWANHNPMVAISTLCSQCQASHCQYNPGLVELACMSCSCTTAPPRFEPIFPSIDHIHDPLHTYLAFREMLSSYPCWFSFALNADIKPKKFLDPKSLRDIHPSYEPSHT